MTFKGYQGSLCLYSHYCTQLGFKHEVASMFMSHSTEGNLLSPALLAHCNLFCFETSFFRKKFQKENIYIILVFVNHDVDHFFPFFLFPLRHIWESTFIIFILQIKTWRQLEADNSVPLNVFITEKQVWEENMKCSPLLPPLDYKIPVGTSVPSYNFIKVFITRGI